MCCYSPRCTVTFAGVWCLLQSIAWAVLAFLGISLYACDLEVAYEKENPVFYLYFVYFLNRECADIPDDLNFEKIIENAVSTTLPAIPTTPFMPPTWPKKFGPVDYTHNLMLGYAVLSTLWAVTSFLVIVAGTVHIRSWVAYVPWIIITISNIVLDVVATINFTVQATKSQTALGLLELIGVQNIPAEEDSYEFLRSIKDVSMIPSLVMALLSSRVVVFWLLNVILVICVIQATYQLSRDKGKNTELPTYPYHRDDNIPVENNTHVDAGNSNLARVTNKLNLQPNDGYISPRPFSYTPDDPKMTSLFLPQPSIKNGLASNTIIPRAGLYTPPSEPEYLECLAPNPWVPADNSKPQSLPLPILSRKVPAIPRVQKTDSGKVIGPGVRRRAPDVTQTDSDRSQPSGIDLHRNSGSMPPDELRGQLPWSYFGPRDAPMKPKPKQSPVVEEELERPPVPVPDYTLHFGKMNRPSTSNWSEDGLSSTNSSMVNHHGAPAHHIVDRSNSLLERSRY